MSKMTATKQFYAAMVLLLVMSICLPQCFARPQSTINSQDSSSDEVVPNMSEWQKFYSNYNSVHNQQQQQQQPPAMEDSSQGTGASPLERLQFELLARLAQQNAIVGSSGGSGGGLFDPLYRMPEMKRQVRYRQCYFNPISCFRK